MIKARRLTAGGSATRVHVNIPAARGDVKFQDYQLIDFTSNVTLVYIQRAERLGQIDLDPDRWSDEQAIRRGLRTHKKPSVKQSETAEFIG